MAEQVPLEQWLAQHAGAEGAVGLVCTDLVESTSLLYSRKTIEYTNMLRSHRYRAATLIGLHGGHLVDRTGDQHFAVFPSARQAYAFARDLFHEPGHGNLSIRVGVHYGPVRADGSGLVGRHVHLAARVMQHAAGHELWLSHAAKSALESEAPGVVSELSWLKRDDCELKGIPHKQSLWRVA